MSKIRIMRELDDSDKAFLVLVCTGIGLLLFMKILIHVKP
jgi:hypothetical protein